MTAVHYIAMDTHARTTAICVKTRANRPGKCWTVRTGIPMIREVLESVPRPRKLTFEEGPLADWLWRNLKDLVDEAIVCDPRKNALVAKDGDKDDPIDADKLCNLYLGGFLRKVHHPESLSRQVAKQTVAMYHERVEARVRAGNKVLGMLKLWGIVVPTRQVRGADTREAILAELAGRGPEAAVAAGHVRLLLASWEAAMEQEEILSRELRKLAGGDEQAQRWQAVPGIGPVRAMTLLAYLDTPWRFASKSALFKYLGIGLVRWGSGEGRRGVHVERQVNRRLKSVILGAAKQVIAEGDNPFADQHRRWVAAGLSPKNARRNVARSLAQVLWGMWKNGGVYDPARVGSGP